MNQPTDPDQNRADKSRRITKKSFAPLSLVGKSATVPPEAAKQWDAVLCCHRCRGRFTIRNLPLKRIALLPQVVSCPHCAACSSAGAEKLHLIVDLRQAKD